MDNTLEKVVAILADVSQQPASDFAPDVELMPVLLDSLDFVSAVMDIEDAFEIEADDKEWAGAKTVGDLCALVRQKVEARHE